MGILMTKIYLFKPLEEIEESQKIFYANNFLILHYRRIYFVIISEYNKKYHLVKIEPLSIKENKVKYDYQTSIHNGAKLIEVRFSFLKEATVEDMKNDGVLSDLVAMRLSGQIV